MSKPRIMTAEQFAEKSARNRASRMGVEISHPAVKQPDSTKRKYHNRKTTIDSITFDSAKEARRYGELCLMQSAGDISDLHCHPVIKCLVNGQLVCKYIADFCYLDKHDLFRLKYEDVKSDHTRKLPVYRIKKKLVNALFGIEIIEV